ncbi:hypothetical protein [Rhodococcus sp. SJ-2]
MDLVRVTGAACCRSMR